MTSIIKTLKNDLQKHMKTENIYFLNKTKKKKTGQTKSMHFVKDVPQRISQ